SSIHGETFAFPGTGFQTLTFSAPVALTTGHQYAISFHLAAGFDNYKDPVNTPPAGVQAMWDQHVYSFGTAFPSSTSGGWSPIMPKACAGAASTTPSDPPVPGITTPDFPLETACSTQDICNLIQQTLQSVTLLRSMVDLVQRQNAPFGYVVGTVHSGLSGSGSFTVSDILGLLVQVSTVPAKWGLSSDNPVRYIPAPAMVAVGTADGDQDTHFVHFTEELLFPTAMGAMTKVTYEFKPGCGGAITELVKEP